MLMHLKHEEDPPTAKKARVDVFANLRDGRSSSTQTSQLPLFCCLVEITLHATKPRRSELPTTDRPLEFWRQHATEYPVLSPVARRVYCICISASSAQSQRDFSSVGHTITDVRFCLSASKVEAIELVRWGLRAGLLSSC